MPHVGGQGSSRGGVPQLHASLKPLGIPTGGHRTTRIRTLGASAKQKGRSHSLPCEHVFGIFPEGDHGTSGGATTVVQQARTRRRPTLHREPWRISQRRFTINDSCVGERTHLSGKSRGAESYLPPHRETRLLRNQLRSSRKNATGVAQDATTPVGASWHEPGVANPARAQMSILSKRKDLMWHPRDSYKRRVSICDPCAIISLSFCFYSRALRERSKRVKQ